MHVVGRQDEMMEGRLAGRLVVRRWEGSFRQMVSALVNLSVFASSMP